jgi:hypothetical protein
MDFYSGLGDGHSVLILAQLRAKGVWFPIFAFVEGVRRGRGTHRITWQPAAFGSGIERNAVTRLEALKLGPSFYETKARQNQKINTITNYLTC